MVFVFLTLIFQVVSGRFRWGAALPFSSQFCPSFSLMSRYTCRTPAITPPGSPYKTHPNTGLSQLVPARPLHLRHTMRELSSGQTGGLPPHSNSLYPCLGFLHSFHRPDFPRRRKKNTRPPPSGGFRSVFSVEPPWPFLREGRPLVTTPFLIDDR